jgi:5'-3' exonuclease
MGIPFYFASLLKSHPGIVETVKKDTPLEVDVFGVDFNCLIHRYLNESDPVKSVLDAFDHILQTICKAKLVYVSLDGLVPYAKIVNQRYRRMRSKESSDIFDRNQISPDTPYMRELEEGLKARFPFVKLSTTQEPGEGEHKLFLEIQSLPEDQRRSVCIYGLDADLILISLIHHKVTEPYKLHLLRESAEFNDPKVAGAEFGSLSIWKLLTQLPMDILQYAALSILCFGNDFMPNLAMFSLREDGYSRALHMYEQSGKPDLLTPEGRTRFLEHAATVELKVLRERAHLRRRPEEKAIFGKDSSLASKKFSLHYLDGVSNIGFVVDAFWKTFHWTFHYFMNGTPLNWDWVYPYPEAPLITDIVEYEESEAPKSGKCKYTLRNQLCFILPEVSLKKTRRKVMFPDEIYTQTRPTWMKRHDWETKPRISLPWNPQYELTHVECLSKL